MIFLDWKFYKKGHNIYDRENYKPGMGYVYILKIYIYPKTYLTKIGATTAPDSRFSNLGRNVKICCVSKPHYNYFENEMILHKAYEEFRVPNSPNSFSNEIRPELFNISLIDIFKTIPSLNFETNLKNCTPHKYAKVNAVWYTSKNKSSRSTWR